MVGEFPTAVPLGFSISGFGGICCRLYCRNLWPWTNGEMPLEPMGFWCANFWAIWLRTDKSATIMGLAPRKRDRHQSAGLICFQDMEFGHCLGIFFFGHVKLRPTISWGWSQLISWFLTSVPWLKDVWGIRLGGCQALGAGTRGQAPEERREQWESDGVQVSAAWPKERFGLLNAFEKMIRSFFFEKNTCDIYIIYIYNIY
jgi:hypothetical protein